MASKTKSSPKPESQPAAQPENIQEVASEGLRVIGHFVRDVSFECPQLPQADPQSAGNALEMQLNIQSGQVGEDLYGIDLLIQAIGRAPGAQAPMFVAEVTYAGIFHHPKTSPDVIRKAINTQGAGLLYPYARHLVTTLIQGAGVRPPFIEAVDFDAIYVSNQATVTS